MVGDIVLMVDNTSPRSNWPLARITEVFTNPKDGLVRAVMAKTNGGMLKRPIDKLVLLEASEQDPASTQQD